MSDYTLKLSAKDIFEKEFEKSLRGFKPIEVDSFLDDVISDYQKMADMNNNIKKLEEENARLKKKLKISASGWQPIHALRAAMDRVSKSIF